MVIGGNTHILHTARKSHARSAPSERTTSWMIGSSSSMGRSSRGMVFWDHTAVLERAVLIKRSTPLCRWGELYSREVAEVEEMKETTSGVFIWLWPLGQLKVSAARAMVEDAIWLAGIMATVASCRLAYTRRRSSTGFESVICSQSESAVRYMTE